MSAPNMHIDWSPPDWEPFDPTKEYGPDVYLFCFWFYTDQDDEGTVVAARQDATGRWAIDGPGRIEPTEHWKIFGPVALPERGDE
jgi:hypothetical protein